MISSSLLFAFLFVACLPLDFVQLLTRHHYDKNFASDSARRASKVLVIPLRDEIL